MKKILLLLLICVCHQNAFSQSYQILNTAGGSFENFQPLLDVDDLYGYVELRKLDLDDKLTVRYKYIVLDKNFNSICTGEFVENLIKKKCEKDNYDIVYNNGNIIFNFRERFNDSGNYMPVRTTYQVLDIANNKIIASGNYDQSIKGDESIPKLNKNFKMFYTYPNADNGFLIESRKEIDDELKVFYYAIDFKGNKIWEQDYKKAEEKHEFEYALIKKEFNTTVLLATKTRHGKKVSDHLLILDSKTGKEISFTDLFNEKYTLRFSSVTIRDEKIYIIGRFFEKQRRDDVDSEESLGLYRRIVDIKTGKITSDTFLPYAKFNNLNINENGRIKKEGYLSFQRININPDGSYFIIAEPYIRKSSGNIFTELYVFLLDKDFNVSKVTAYDTNRTRGSKYDFSQDLPNKIGKAYFFYDKTDNKEFELNILNYTYSSSAFSVSKMKLSNDLSNISIVPAKTGFVGIREVFKNPKKGEKSLEIRLEKLNYER